jgi:hypothetical protein
MEFRDTPGNSISVDFRSWGEVGESPVAFIAIGRILSGRTLSGQRENAEGLEVVSKRPRNYVAWDSRLMKEKPIKGEALKSRS